MIPLGKNQKVLSKNALKSNKKQPKTYWCLDSFDYLTLDICRGGLNKILF